MLEYTRMNSTFKPSSEILWATGLSSLLTKQRLGITAKKKLRMFCTNYTQSSTYNSFFCPSSKMLWFWDRRHCGYSSFKLYTSDIAVISLLCCQIIWSCQYIKYITYICDQRKYTKKKRQRRHPFLKKCSVPFLVAQRFDPLEANYIFALLWSIFISSVVDCWQNYLKCASRFKPPLTYSLLTGFRSTLLRPNYTFLAWPRSIPWKMSRDWQVVQPCIG